MNEDIDNKDNKEGEEAVVLDEVAAGVEPEETVIPFTRQEEEQPLTMEEEIEETEQIEKKLQESWQRYSESTEICQDLRNS
ncbi:MAG: hypothetical protein ACLT33_13860 [Lachnospira pectinoschiza]